MKVCSFPNPWAGYDSETEGPVRCLDEWCIIDISNLIRLKNSWKVKYKDEAIVQKWKCELEPQFKDRTRNFNEVFDYVIKELRWYEYLEKNFPRLSEYGFHLSIDDTIVVSDAVIPVELRDSFKEAVESFVSEEFPEGHLDYHPGSDNKVADIVHPSMYPLQYGKTPVFVKANTVCPYTHVSWANSHTTKYDKLHKSRTIDVCKYDEDRIKSIRGYVEEYGISKNFQWLPAALAQDVWIHNIKTDRPYAFKSYINNLHPLKYSKLYELISNIFNRLLPGLNLCLSRLASSPYVRMQIPMNDREKVFSAEYNRQVDLFDWNDPNKYENLDKLEVSKKDHVQNIPPPAYPGDRPVNYSFDMVEKYKNLKVIVKLSNIELTPEKPSYNGGTWHIEGTVNEDIVATVLYYYDSENITELTLSFRSAIEDPDYEQNDDFCVEHFYGLKIDDIMTKNLGSVETKQDRLLIFPNIFQHRVDGFELDDKSRPGHRKILCMFLVNPENDVVVTTQDVPPQQQSWWKDEHKMGFFGLSEYSRDEILNLKGIAKKVEEPQAQKSAVQQVKSYFTGKLWSQPSAVQDSPATEEGEVNKWPLDDTEAKEVREVLMAERTAPMGDYCEDPFDRTFSLCEH